MEVFKASFNLIINGSIQDEDRLESIKT